LFDMAALRGVGEGLELFEEFWPGFGRAEDSGAAEWAPGAVPVRVIMGVFSKLRARLWGLVETTALAASLLRCTEALSFFALEGATGVLARGAREVMGKPGSKDSINSTFNVPKQIHRFHWPRGRFS
jgi:hypothetical protein